MSLFPSPSFDHYWAMWNEMDPARVRGHLDRAVTDDFVFCDPLHFHVGRDALEANVHAFRADQPKASFEIGSGIDAHHNRCRYAWHLIRRGRVLVRGFDVATIADNGLIERIDGFFGELTAIGAAE
jgi:SnoaL-like domain